MIVFKSYLGQSGTQESIRSLLGSGELVPLDSWSEVGFSYEKYDNEDLQRAWSKIKTEGGLQNLDKVPSDGTWGILYEKQT